MNLMNNTRNYLNNMVKYAEGCDFVERLSSFLVEGSTIKSKLDKATEWIPNIAHKIDFNKNEIEIALDERYISDLVMVGDKMRLTQTVEGYEYIIDCTIIQIRIEPERVIQLRVNDISKTKNLRKDERFSVNYATTIQSFSEEGGVFGVVVDISVSGLAFVCRNNFVPGEMVRLSIMLPSSTFTIDAEIMRVTDGTKGNEYGVRFLRTDEEAIRDIKKLIEDIKEREDRLSHIVGFKMF